MREHCFAAWFFGPSAGKYAEGGFPAVSFNPINLFNPIFSGGFQECFP
jgi:hypothetical protein